MNDIMNNMNGILNNKRGHNIVNDIVNDKKGHNIVNIMNDIANDIMNDVWAIWNSFADKRDGLLVSKIICDVKCF